MVKKVSDRGSLERWLSGKPREVAVAIAVRAALRVFPCVIIDEDHQISNVLGLAFITERALLVASVAPVSSTKKIGRIPAFVATTSSANNYAAKAAADAAFAVYVAIVADAASAAVANAATAYAYATGNSAADAFWIDVSNDLTAFENGIDAKSVLEFPLWQNRWKPEIPLAKQWTKIWKHLDAHPLDWSFWIDWYQGILDGRPQNWEMLEEIALIDPEDWDKGAEHVNGLISGIQAQYLRKATPYSEKIEINPDTGKLRSVPKPMDNERLYRTALERVRDALDDLRPNGILAQHHGGLEKIAKRLDRTLDRYDDNPQRVHDDFLLSAKQIATLVESTEVAKDEDVDTLQSSLITGSDDIRAADAEVKASVAARVALRLEEMRVEDTEVIAKTVETLAEIGEGVLKDEFEEDAIAYRQIIVDWPEGDSPPLGGANYEESVDRLFRTAAQTSRAMEALKSGTVVAGKVGKGVIDGYTFTEIMLKLGRALNVFLSHFG